MILETTNENDSSTANTSPNIIDHPSQSIAIRTSNEFTGTVQAVQFRLPIELVKALRMLASESGNGLSLILFEALTTEATVVCGSHSFDSQVANGTVGQTEMIQVQLPSDLIQSLRLLAFRSSRNLNDLVTTALTTEVPIAKAWICHGKNHNDGRNQTTAEFTGPRQPIKFQFPGDLIGSLQALCAGTDQKLSDVVFQLMTTSVKVTNIYAIKRNCASCKFKGELRWVQLLLPSDLILSMQLHSYESGRSISSVCFEAMTTDHMVAKSSVATRKSA